MVDMHFLNPNGHDKEIIFHQPGIHHSFKHLANASSEGDRAIAAYLRQVFSWLQYWKLYSLLQHSGYCHLLPNQIATLYFQVSQSFVNNTSTACLNSARRCIVSLRIIYYWILLQCNTFQLHNPKLLDLRVNNAMVELVIPI